MLCDWHDPWCIRYRYRYVQVRECVLYRLDIQWDAKWNTISSTIRASAWEGDLCMSCACHMRGNRRRGRYVETLV